MKKLLLLLSFSILTTIGYSQTIGQEVLNFNNGCGNPASDSGGVVIKTKYKFSNTGYMPTVIIEGYNYGGNQSVGLIINWYVYNVGQGDYFYQKSISSYGAYAPEVFLYNDGGFVSIFLKRGVSQYCLSFKVRSWLRATNESSSDATWYSGWTANTVNTPPTPTNNYGKVRYENTIGDATVTGERSIRLNSGAGVVKIKGDAGGWAMNYGFNGSGGADLGGFWGYGAANAIDQWSIGKAYTDNFFVVKSGGNVGIGTNTPQTRLEVNSGINDVSIFKGTAGIAAFRFYNDINKGVSLFTYKSDYSVNSGSVFSVGANGSGVIQEANAPMAIGTWQVAQPLIFGTNSVEKMRILSDGKVGIGTSNPSEKLTVYGVNNSAPAILSLESSREDIVNADVAMIKFKNSGNEIARIGTIRPAGSYTGLINFWVKRTNETPLFEAMRIAESGNVGIGTTAPISPLHVSGGSPMTHGWNKTLTLQASYPTIIFNSNSQKWGGIGYDYSSSMNFWVGGSSDDLTSTATAAMSIAQNGNVGIGTSTPNARLEIVSPNGTSGLRLSGLTGLITRPLSVNASGDVIVGDAVANPSANAWTVSGNNISNSVLSGNVGIGTNSPSEKLSVSGNSFASGYFISGTGANGYYGWGQTVPSNTLNTNDPDYNRAVQFGIYRINHHTGISMSAHSAYGGIRFYNQGYDATSSNPYTANGNTMVMAINNNSVGIGTITPTEKLDIIGNAKVSGSVRTANIEVGNPSGDSNIQIGSGGGATGSRWAYLDLVGDDKYNDYGLRLIRQNNGENSNSQLIHRGTGDLQIYTNEAAPISFVTGTTEKMRISANGNIGIGTTDTKGYKLAVAGEMIAERVVVKLQTAWPDFVFKKSFSLRPLSEVEIFINQNSHLPEVPSAADVADKGIDVGAMNAKLLQKVEELTLYLIEMKKENEKQTQEIEKLKLRINR